MDGTGAEIEESSAIIAREKDESDQMIGELLRHFKTIGMPSDSKLECNDCFLLKRLDASFREHQLLIDHMPSGVAYHQVVFDPGGSPVDLKYIYINPPFERIIGQKNSEVAGRKVSQVLPQIKRDEMEWLGEFIDVAMNNTTKRLLRYVPVQKAWYSVLAYSPAKGYCVTITHDITEEKRTLQALQQSETQLRSIFENVGEALVVVDEGGVVESINPATEIIFGYPAAELQGSSFLKLIPERYHPMHQHILQLSKEQLRFALQQLKKAERTIYARHQSGKEFPADIRINIMEVNHETKLILVVRDITDQLKLQEEEIARAAADQTSQLKSEYLANMSHELRTPLSSILTNAQLIEHLFKNGVLDDESLLEGIGDIINDGKHLTLLVEDILDIAKIEAGKLHLNMEIVDFAQALDMVISSTKKSLDQKGLWFKVELEKDFPLLYADSHRLHQVLLNLMSNAIKFTEQGGIFLQAELSKSSPGSVKIDITDTGKGIPEKYLNRIFLRFERADKENQSPGTGLGLSICKRLIELMGGEISVNSTMNIGTTFSFTLRIYNDCIEQKHQDFSDG